MRSTGLYEADTNTREYIPSHCFAIHTHGTFHPIPTLQLKKERKENVNLWTKKNSRSVPVSLQVQLPYKVVIRQQLTIV